ncbi:MAG: hypothetical protein LUQ59_08125, partial [Methanothrix sp.]|nr:hypothetical protein [Methanothrix sp.]
TETSKASFRRYFKMFYGETPGYPRFKLDGSKLTLSKIGSIRIFKHREVEGKSLSRSDPYFVQIIKAS